MSMRFLYISLIPSLSFFFKNNKHTHIEITRSIECRLFSFSIIKQQKKMKKKSFLVAEDFSTWLHVSIASCFGENDFNWTFELIGDLFQWETIVEKKRMGLLEWCQTVFEFRTSRWCYRRKTFGKIRWFRWEKETFLPLIRCRKIVEKKTFAIICWHLIFIEREWIWWRTTTLPII